MSLRPRRLRRLFERCDDRSNGQRLDQHQAVITHCCLLFGDNLKRILRECGFDGIAE